MTAGFDEEKKEKRRASVLVIRDPETGNCRLNKTKFGNLDIFDSASEKQIIHADIEMRDSHLSHCEEEIKEKPVKYFFRSLSEII